MILAAAAALREDPRDHHTDVVVAARELSPGVELTSDDVRLTRALPSPALRPVKRQGWASSQLRQKQTTAAPSCKWPSDPVAPPPHPHMYALRSLGC